MGYYTFCLLMFSALEQFGIYPVSFVPSDLYILGWLFSKHNFCNYSWVFASYFSSLVFNIFLVGLLFSFVYLNDRLLQNYFLIIISVAVNAVQTIINEVYLYLKGRAFYTSLLLILFFLILYLNIIGLTPYSLALTSHFSATFTLALLFFLMLNLTGVYYNGVLMLSLFFPAGTPGFIVPLLVLIEFISYNARVFSLSIRLFANITAGHILVKIISGFVFVLFHFVLVGVLGWLLVTLLWCLEFFISVLQAYVFLILLTIYTQDAMALH